MKSQILFRDGIFYSKNIQNTYFDWIYFFLLHLLLFIFAFSFDWGVITWNKNFIFSHTKTNPQTFTELQ